MVRGAAHAGMNGVDTVVAPAKRIRAMRAAHIGIAVLALMPAVAIAADEPSTPPLTSTTVVQTNDSPLVMAAKKAVASRHGSGRVIDNNFVASSKGLLSIGGSTGSYDVSTDSMYPGGQPGVQLSTSPRPSGPDRATIQKKVDQLRQENARMRDEAEQPYGGDISEDRVQQRLEQIPGEIQNTQQQLTPMPVAQPANPTPQPPGDQP